MENENKPTGGNPYADKEYNPYADSALLNDDPCTPGAADPSPEGKYDAPYDPYAAQSAPYTPDDAPYEPQVAYAPIAQNAPSASAEPVQKEMKLWSIFALAGKICGIAAVVVAFIPVVNMYLSIMPCIGLALSIIAKIKSKIGEKNAKLGIILNAAAIVITPVVFFGFLVLLYGGYAIVALLYSRS